MTLKMYRDRWNATQEIAAVLQAMTRVATQYDLPLELHILIAKAHEEALACSNLYYEHVRQREALLVKNDAEQLPEEEEEEPDRK